MTNYEFQVAAKNGVIRAIRRAHDEIYGIHDISIINLADVCGNKTATLIDSGNNNRYYEVTYDKDSDAFGYEERVTVDFDSWLRKDADFTVHE